MSFFETAIFLIYITLIFVAMNQSNRKLNSKIEQGKMEVGLPSEELSKSIINELSYQHYAKFHNNAVPHDEKFEEKINKISNLIQIDKIMDIKEIAEKSGCTYDECILKIGYLKNKRLIGTYHIDKNTEKLIPCSQKDFKLIEKYKPYIYYNHLQPKDIAIRMPGVTSEKLKEAEEKIYNEILYLEKNDLLNGIKINEVDKKIVYYAVEKNMVKDDLITLSCPNCGALNDVNRGSKTRCEYCNSIIVDKIIEENI